MLGSRKTESVTVAQSRLRAQASYLYPINTKNYIFLQNQSAFLNSDDYLTNELFRIGGVYNIRGVNEESIFASAYTVFNLEYRFRPNPSSYFYTITDFSYTENKADDQSANLISLGLGYGFTTKAGVLNLSYAIGKFDDAPFTFDNSKIHIKIISNF
jgi:hemolysin activation/secretion protein